MSTLKRFMFENLLANGHIVVVAAVCTQDLKLPQAHRYDGVMLQYCEAYANLNLEITDEGISANLSFDKEREHTFVPWRSIVHMHAYGEVSAQFPVDVNVFVPKPTVPS